MIYQPIPDKRCKDCHRFFPATTDHFHIKASNRDRLHLRCKTCRSTKMKAYYQENHEERLTKTRQYRDANRVAVRDTDRRSRERHIEKRRANSRAYRQAHRESLGRHNAAYQRRLRQEEPERMRRYMHIKNHNRLARNRKAEGRHSADDVAAQYERQQGRCYWCSKELSDDYQVDHVIPLARGGSNWPQNIVIACPFCNRSKDDKIPFDEWTPPCPLSGSIS